MQKPAKNKVRFFPVTEVRGAFSRAELGAIETAAWDAYFAAGKGPNIHYLKFKAQDRTFCLAARANVTGKTLDIEYDFISPGTTGRVITTEEHQRSEGARRERGRSRPAAAPVVQSVAEADS